MEGGSYGSLPRRLIVRHKSSAGHRVFGGTTKGKRISPPRRRGGCAPKKNTRSFVSADDEMDSSW